MGLPQWIQDTLGLAPATQNKIVLSVVVLVLLWVGRRTLLRIVLRDSPELRTAIQWERGTRYAYILLAVMFVGPVWLDDLGNLTTYLGLVSAGIAIALKDPILNIFGWLFIVLRSPFRVGDRIQAGAHAGDVVDIGLFQFSIQEIGNWVNADQPTGRIIHIPNGRLFLEPIANYSEGLPYLWNEIPLTITFESDWEQAKAILLEIAGRNSPDLGEEWTTKYRRASREIEISHTNLVPGVYTNLQPNGVGLTVRYLCPPDQRRKTAQSIVEETLRAFARSREIELAYPTFRYHKTEAA